MKELIDQNVSADWIVFASSSGGTRAGLLLGQRGARCRGDDRFDPHQIFQNERDGLVLAHWRTTRAVCE
jgi:hypothetical protein